MALRALPRCWTHLAGVSDGIKLYLGSIIIIKNLSHPFRCDWGAGWDGWQQAPLDEVFYK
jgi:hypothetical protein